MENFYQPTSPGSFYYNDEWILGQVLQLWFSAGSLTFAKCWNCSAVLGGSTGWAGHGSPAGLFGLGHAGCLDQSPIDPEKDAAHADDDVAQLDFAVKHRATWGLVNALAILYAAMSATSSNCWKLSVINEASGSAYLVVRPSRTSWMAA